MFDLITAFRYKTEKSRLLSHFACYNFPYYKLLMLLQLTIFVILGSINSPSLLGPVVASIALSILIDSTYNKFIYSNFAFPSGSIITALIISGIVFPGKLVPAVGVTTLAIALKHLTKRRYRNLFNPAALGLYIGAILFGTSLTWWISASMVVSVIGLIVVFLTKNEDLALSFLIPYWLLTVLISGEVSLSLLLGGQVVFFAFIMVIEPVTSPNTRRSRIIFGFSVAVLAIILQLIRPLVPGYLSWVFVDNLLLALLVMNFTQRLIPRRWMA